MKQTPTPHRQIARSLTQRNYYESQTFHCRSSYPSHGYSPNCNCHRQSPEIVNHAGMCDASAAVPVGHSLFVVANDEDSTLRIYRRDESGDAIYSKDIFADLKIDLKDDPETDIEGATLIGKRIYWITSHGTNKDGKQSPSRHRFFATDIETNGNGVILKSSRDSLSLANPGPRKFPRAEGLPSKQSR